MSIAMDISMFCQSRFPIVQSFQSFLITCNIINEYRIFCLQKRNIYEKYSRHDGSLVAKQ